MQRITIIGIGPIGASIGLALKRAGLSDTEIVGTSGDRDLLSAVSKLGAVDKTISNLRSAVDDAQIVILDTPLGETRELLEAIGPMLGHGSVITDTGIAKERVIEWAEESLPRGVSFVGGHPLPKKQPRSLEEADASLFEDITYCIIPAKSADQEAVKAVVGMVETLGAKPLFLDISEHDSYAAAMSYLPIVLSAAYVTTTSNSESWREMHRLAGPEFGDLSRLVANDPQDNETACLSNPDALVHWLDQMITELYSYRNQIKERSDDLLDNLIRGWEAQARWEVGTVVEEEGQRLPSAGEMMATSAMGGRLFDRYKQTMGRDKKKESWKYERKS